MIQVFPAESRFKVLPIVDPQGSEHTAKIHQDLTLYLNKLDAGKELVFEQCRFAD